jgi:coenzyme PQQ precursor peptide PqqA
LQHLAADPAAPFAMQQRSSPELALKRFHWRTLRSSVPYSGGRNSSGSKKESQMAWKAPKIIEVPVGMEINMYACAARK